MSRLSMIVRVNVVLNVTLTDVSTTCAVVIFRVKVSCIRLLAPILGIRAKIKENNDIITHII